MTNEKAKLLAKQSVDSDRESSDTNEDSEE